MAFQLISAVFTEVEDIAKRVCDHIGTSHIDDIDEDSKAARLIKFNYPKLRQAELRRNVWRFSVRRSILRPLNIGPDVDDPTMHIDPSVYSATVTYAAGSIIESDASLWLSNKSTIGSTPGVQGSDWENYFGSLCVHFWDSTNSPGYHMGEFVYTDGTHIYMSRVNGNKDDPLVNANGFWVRQINVTLLDVNIFYPINTGPVTSSSTANAYELPYGFLRKAPQSPKAGSNSVLGGPSGLPYLDWDFEGNFLMTRETQPIALRFAADVTDISTMDTMFCEGLACRIALEVCEPITQSTERLRNIAGEYGKHMSEARMVNGIETGATEPAEDDFVTCRL